MFQSVSRTWGMCESVTEWTQKLKWVQSRWSVHLQPTAFLSATVPRSVYNWGISFTVANKSQYLSLISPWLPTPTSSEKINWTFIPQMKPKWTKESKWSRPDLRGWNMLCCSSCWRSCISKAGGISHQGLINGAKVNTDVMWLQSTVHYEIWVTCCLF